MPAPYTYTPFKIGPIEIVVIPSGQTISNVPTSVPTGSLASDPGNSKLYFKTATGWVEK